MLICVIDLSWIPVNNGTNSRLGWTNYSQGHPMDLFLKISVLQAHFCWLGDVEEIIVLGRKVLLEKDNSECQRGFEV